MSSSFVSENDVTFHAVTLYNTLKNGKTEEQGKKKGKESKGMHRDNVLFRDIFSTRVLTP